MEATQLHSPTVNACRTHEICAGHRVFGHESKCSKIHGHNYSFEFHCNAEKLDEVGRVIDFSVIKSTLCRWLEDHWDHQFLVWEHDPIASSLEVADPDGVVRVPFNPTAENLAEHVLTVVAPELLADTGVRLQRLVLHETKKCWVEAQL